MQLSRSAPASLPAALAAVQSMSLDPLAPFQNLLRSDAPILALAPMQDVTDLPFWRLMTTYGGADLYFTEYFRVHADSRLNPGILASITENPTGRPAIRPDDRE